MTLLLVLAGCSSPTRKYTRRSDAPLPTGTREVVRVIDGDTVELNGGDRVRINYINTPEKREELGRESSALARKLCRGKMVRVESRGRGGYGRVLGDIYCDKKSLAHSMVASGLAHVMIIPPFDADTAKVLLAAQAKARARKSGIWDTGRYQGFFHITSFHANAKGKDKFNLNGEYLRIANVTSQQQSISGYTLVNRKGEEFLFGDVKIPGGHTLMVFSGHGEDQTNAKKQIRLYWRRKDEAWNNWGDTATLRDSAETVVDQVIHKPRRRR